MEVFFLDVLHAPGWAKNNEWAQSCLSVILSLGVCRLHERRMERHKYHKEKQVWNTRDNSEKIEKWMPTWSKEGYGIKEVWIKLWIIYYLFSIYTTILLTYFILQEKIEQHYSFNGITDQKFKDRETADTSHASHSVVQMFQSQVCWQVFVNHMLQSASDSFQFTSHH
jgi:hypothetical protein